MLPDPPGGPGGPPRGDGPEQPGGPASSGALSGRESAERLEALAGVEAWKARMAESVAPDPARLAEGWQRRFVADGPRAEEAAALYRELGFDVCMDPVDPKELADDCKECALVAALRFKTLYTRRSR